MLARLTAFISILLAPIAVLAQPVADHVPADSMVYLAWQGSTDLGPGYAQSNLKAVLDDSQIPEFLDKFLPQVLDKVTQLNPQAGVIGTIVETIAKPSWKHPTAFFFAGIDQPAGQEPVPHLGIIWLAGADGDELAKGLNDLVGQIPAPFPIKVVRDQQLVALMVGYDNAAVVLAADKSKTLAGDPAFKAAWAHLTVKDATFAAYVDYERLFGMADKMIDQNGPPEAKQIWPKVREDLGLTGLKRIVVGSGFEGKDYGTQAFLESPEPRTGILKLAQGKPLEEDILAAIPSTVTMAGAGRFDLAGLYEVIRKTADDIDPDIGHEVDRFIDRIASESDVDLRKDLLASVGDEWAYFADPAIGGRGLASVTLVNRLKDPAKFEKSMSKIQDYVLQQIQKEAGAQLPVTIGFQTTQVDGMTIHYLAVPLVSPSWVVQDGTLFVSLFPQVAAGAARHLAHKGPSILQDEGFVALRERLGSPKAAGFNFMDLPKTAPDAYGAWLVISRLAGFGDLFGIQSPPMILPELDKLMSRLSPAGSAKWVDAEGFHLRSIEPFPGSTVVASDPMTSAIYAEPLMISIMLPALNRAREQANRVKSASNLRQIGLAAMIYANDHKNEFPPDFATMLNADLAPDVFVNPRTTSGGAPPVDREEFKRWVNDRSDYIWLGRGRSVTTAGADIVIAHEKLEDNTEGVNLLFGDGHVEFMPMYQAHEAIEKSKQAGKVNGNL